MSDGLTAYGLSIVCETCENDIDFPDDITAETCICRHCGIAFLVDPPARSERAARAG
jgi:hypothetical protein